MPEGRIVARGVKQRVTKSSNWRGGVPQDGAEVGQLQLSAQALAREGLTDETLAVVVMSDADYESWEGSLP